MKAAAFEYYRPDTKAEALELARGLHNAKFLAGGQSLVAMLNMRYAIVDNLIDLNRVPGLEGIAIDGDTLRVGAMTRQKRLKADPTVAKRAPIFAAALDFVGHLQTRNRGTVGGSLCHLDPAAELIGLAFLHDAVVHVEQVSGTREIPISEFPLSYMTPSISPDELVTAVSYRLPREQHGWGFQEFAQRHGDFAVAGVATLVEMTGDTVERASISLFGIGMTAVRASAAEATLLGERPTSEAIEAAAAAAVQEVEISGDAMASSAYRRRLVRVLTKRALRDAVGRVSKRS